MPASSPKKPRSDTTINVRLPANGRFLIDSAAAIAGKTRTEFILDSATRSAIDVVLDQRLFALDDAAFDQFLAELDHPPAPPARLKALFKKTAPWDR